MKELKEFTVERLEEIISRALVSMDEASALAKIALAAKQAKPVAWITQPAFEDNNGTAFVFMSEANLSGCIPFYTAQPLNHAEQDGWVKCSERMPEDSQWCAVSTGYGYYIQCWGSEQGWLGEEVSIPNCDVTHWMPLPAAPKPEM